MAWWLVGGVVWLTLTFALTFARLLVNDNEDVDHRNWPRDDGPAVIVRVWIVGSSGVVAALLVAVVSWLLVR